MREYQFKQDGKIANKVFVVLGNKSINIRAKGKIYKS